MPGRLLVHVNGGATEQGDLGGQRLRMGNRVSGGINAVTKAAVDPVVLRMYT